VGTLGGTTSELAWLKNPGNLGSDGTGWSDWEQFKLVEGPDVFFKMEMLVADDGVAYEVKGRGPVRYNR
jgi:hypothetical protein